MLLSMKRRKEHICLLRHKNSLIDSKINVEGGVTKVWKEKTKTMFILTLQRRGSATPSEILNVHDRSCTDTFFLILKTCFVVVLVRKLACLGQRTPLLARYLLYFFIIIR
jgi:hypothetical protein